MNSEQGLRENSCGWIQNARTTAVLIKTCAQITQTTKKINTKNHPMKSGKIIRFHDIISLTGILGCPIA